MIVMDGPQELYRYSVERRFVAWPTARRTPVSPVSPGLT